LYRCDVKLYTVQKVKIAVSDYSETAIFFYKKIWNKKIIKEKFGKYVLNWYASI